MLGDKCVACLTCLRLCPYNVPSITPTGSAEIRENLCRSCGLCVAECPAKAIAFTMPGMEDINKRVDRVLKEITVTPKVVAFYCSYRVSSITIYTDFIKTKPANLGIVTIPCVVKLNTTHLLNAFELGADGVFIAACLETDCPYQHSLFRAKQRVEMARKTISELGLGVERLTMYNMAASEMANFERVTDFMTKVKELSSKP